ncbi:hypothetical protein [Ruminococcus sp. HUN007]|uniref:hypothetical protein n=1 Tax=Ruminococcus sp. HUN007 TaxID=1514668 RepID=UPI0005D13BC3|nr:hypothetical protein [Ruminococcus sp. HUN007]
MRKNKIVLTALLIFGLAFTGCGPMGGKGEEADNAAVTEAGTEVAEETDAVSEESEETAEVTEEAAETAGAVTEAESETSELPAGCDKAIRDYYDALNNSDVDGMLSSFYPEKVIKAIQAVNEPGENDLSQILDGKKQYEITDIELVGEMTEDETDVYMQLFDSMAYSLDKIEEYGGKENLDEEMAEELYGYFLGMAEPDSEMKRTYKTTEGYDVTVKYNVDGEPDEDYFYVFNVEGEGWKLNNEMRKFAKKARQSMSNSTAKSLFTIVQTVLTDLECDGKDVKGQYIISSDEDKCFGIPDTFDRSEYDALFAKYSEDYGTVKDYSYYIFINSGNCEYAAVTKKDGTGDTGVYPVMTVPSEFTGGRLVTESVSSLNGYDYNGLYEKLQSLIR